MTILLTISNGIGMVLITGIARHISNEQTTFYWSHPET